MNWKKWKIGLVIAVFCGVLNAGASLVDGMHWKAFLAVLCTSLLTNLLTYLKDHPVDAISDTVFTTREQVTKVGLILLCCFSPMVAVSGCKTGPAVVAYKAEGVVITTVDTAMKAYADYSKSHAVSQAEVDKLRAVYDKYYNAQQVARMALEAFTASANDGTAAALKVAQDNVAVTSQAVINLVKGFLQ